MAVILLPILILSLFRINIAKIKHPPNIPGASAEANSQSIITLKEIVQKEVVQEVATKAL